MVCKKCGSEVTENMRFCNICGEAIAEAIIQRNPESEATEVVNITEPKTVEEPGAKKQAKKSNLFGAILSSLIMVMVITSLLTWCSIYMSVYGDVREVDDADDYMTEHTVFGLYDYAENELEWVEKQYEEGYMYSNATDMQYYQNVYEVCTVITIVAAIVSVILLISLMLLLIAIFLFVLEKKAGKIFSIIAGILMLITSGAYAIFIPIISKFYSHTILIEANPALYAAIGLSFLVTVLSFFYKGKNTI